MKNLKQFYKEEIKKTAAALKFGKPRSRHLQSLYSKGQKDSQEYQDLLKDMLGISVWSLKIKARHLYLAYALVRNKDLNKVEKNYPEGHDKRYLERLMKTMEESFQSSLIKEEV